MNVRSASADDRDGIAEAARRSFRASYSLSPQEIDAVLADRFSPEAIGARIDDGDRQVFVADGGHAPVSGFAEVGPGDSMRWLHVHPDDRGRGVGTALVERVRAGLDERSAPFTARVLERSREGGQFLEQFGLHWTGNTWIGVGDLRFAEQVYTTEGQERSASEPAVDVPDEVTVAGETRSVLHDEAAAGTVAPFYPFAADGGGRAGFFCSGCGSTAVVSDALDRLECDDCGNTHRPDDWDAAYL